MLKMRVAIMLLLWMPGMAALQAQNLCADLSGRLDSLSSQVRTGSDVARREDIAVARQLQADIAKAACLKLLHQSDALLGRVYQQLGLMSAAEAAYEMAVQDARRLGDSLVVAYHLGTLGDLYTLEEQYERALLQHYEALRLEEAHGKNMSDIATARQRIARVLIQTGRLEEAADYLDKALEAKRAAGDTTRLGVINVLFADIYRRQGRYQEAVDNYLKDIPKRKSGNNYEGLIINYQGLAQTYVAWGQFEPAESYYLLALEAAQKINRKRRSGALWLELGELYATHHKDSLARNCFLEALATSDEVDSPTFQSRAGYQLAILYAAEGRHEEAFRYLMQHLTLKDSLAARSAALRVEDLRAKTELMEKDKAIAVLDRENKKGRTWVRFLLVGLLVLGAFTTVLVGLYRSRNRAWLELKAEQDHIRRLLAEKEAMLQLVSRYESLRNQINPHFLFNSLNSLASLIEVDKDSAVHFTHRFARMYRSILELGDQSLIPLAQELELVKSYMYLQTMRFGDNLQLQLDIAQPETYCVPPFALQLLVENAIKHNIISDARPLAIRIYAPQDGLLRVENPFQPRQNESASTGIGLKNLNERYLLLCGRPIRHGQENGLFFVEIPLILES